MPTANLADRTLVHPDSREVRSRGGPTAIDLLTIDAAAVCCDGPAPRRSKPGGQLRRLTTAISLLSICAIVASCDGSELHPHLISGTERIEPGDIHTPWFTISPDEQWIAFMQVDSLDWDRVESNRRPGGYHLVTVNLATFRKTHHHLNGLPVGTLASDIPPWMDIQLRLEERSWSEGRLYVSVGGGIPPRPWIAFRPGLAMAERVEAPGPRSCCACFPTRDYERVLKIRGLSYYTGTSAYRGGGFAKTIYASPHGADRGAIDRINEDNSVERIFDGKRRFKDVMVEFLLVSPNERHLAFLLTTNLRSPVPLPTMRHELHVLDLTSGAHRRVGGSYRLIGNMMWSEDSRRLYYAAVNGEIADGREDGVFRIDFPQ